MPLVFNTKTFTADSFQKDTVVYFGPAHTGSVKDDLKLSRQAAKPTAIFSGVARTEAKLTRTHTLTGALTPTGESIVAINVSVPVGISSADVDALLNDMGALLSGADFKTHVKNQKVNY